MDLIYPFFQQTKKMQYDFVCTNEECIRNHRSFFKFSMQSIHIINKHQVKPIHPLTFASMFIRTETIESFEKMFKGESIYAQLINTKNQAFETIINIIKSIFQENSLISKVQKILLMCQNLDMEKLCSQMSEGNYQILQQLRQFETQKVERNFKTFLMRRVLSLEEQFKSHLAQLKNSLLYQYNQLRKDYNPELLPVKNPQSFLPEYIKKQEAEEFSYQINKEDNLSQDEEELDQEKPNCVPLIVNCKTKPIKKSLKRKKNSTVSDQIEVVSQRTVIVRQSKNTARTLLYLQQKHHGLKVLHIFNQKIASQTSIKYILNHFPQLYKISFNCYFEFEPAALKQIKPQVLQRVRLQLKWDLNKFFTEYYAYLYFPYKSLKRRQRKKVISLQEMILYFPRNNSIWVSNKQQNKKIHTLQTNPNFIKVLNYSIQDEKDYFRLEIPIKFINVSVLILKNVNIMQTNLIKFMRANKKLHTIIIHQCSMWHGINDFLQEAKKLVELSKLSVCQQFDINLQNIFQLSQLTHLNLDNSFYNRKNQQQKYTNFSKMTKLQHIGLYNDNNIRSATLRNLSPQCLSILKYLNLGRTLVDNQACKYFHKMVSLKYINIDYTNIEGNYFTFFCVIIGKHRNLQQISIQNKYMESDKKLNMQNLRTIAKCLPQLTYLNIAFNENVGTYDFQEFKKLKTLGADKDLYQQLLEIVSPDINLFKIAQSFC